MRLGDLVKMSILVNNEPVDALSLIVHRAVAEERGRGTMRAVMLELMRGARERGAAVSTLVPTAPAAYRPCGHESITTTVDRYGHVMPAAHLAISGAMSLALTQAHPQIEGAG